MMPDISILTDRLSDRIFEAKFYAAYCAAVILPIFGVVSLL